LAYKSLGTQKAIGVTQQGMDERKQRDVLPPNSWGKDVKLAHQETIKYGKS